MIPAKPLPCANTEVVAVNKNATAKRICFLFIIVLFFLCRQRVDSPLRAMNTFLLSGFSGFPFFEDLGCPSDLVVFCFHSTCQPYSFCFIPVTFYWLCIVPDVEVLDAVGKFERSRGDCRLERWILQIIVYQIHNPATQ